jgi:hypothetical protein
MRHGVGYQQGKLIATGNFRETDSTISYDRISASFAVTASEELRT